MSKNLSDLDGRMLLALERERAGIARTLRAETVQVLATVLIGLTSVGRLESLEDVRVALTELREAVRRDLARVERSASEIRPSVLDDFGLAAAVHAIVDSSNLPQGPEVELDWREASPLLRPEQEALLFRIVQEALRNAVCHAAARRITVRLTRTVEHFLVEIHDDGRGFDLSTGSDGSPGGYGIPLMQAQAQVLGGDLELRSRPGKGTTVRLKLPIEGETR